MNAVATAIVVMFVALGPVPPAGTWDYRSGQCSAGTSLTAWAESSLYAIGSDGTRGALICSMGVGCNGRAWNSCDVQGNDGGPLGAEAGPVRPYYDAAHGDSLRSALGDGANHITRLLVSPAEVRVIADRAVVYRAYSLTTGDALYEDLVPVLPGQEKVIALGSVPSGPCMVIAYDPASGISAGYRAFMH